MVFKKGDKVLGVNKEAQMPKQGGIIQRVVSEDYYYVNHVSGGGIGYRSGQELVKNGSKKNLE